MTLQIKLICAGPQGDVALRLLANPLAFLDEMNRTYGQLVGILLGGEHVVLVSDPAAAEKILISGNSQFAKVLLQCRHFKNVYMTLSSACQSADSHAALQEGTAFFPGSRLAGNGLLVSDGAIWQRQRQLSNPGFRKAAVDTYLEVKVMLLGSSFLGSFEPTETGALQRTTVAA